jgi:hypothetical protein
MHLGARSAAVVVALVVAVGVGACGSQSPCTSCQAIEGTYAMQWNTSAVSGSCTAELQGTPATLVLTRAGSRLLTSFAGYRLEGSLYDSLDFTMVSFNGVSDGGSESVRMQGFATASGRADGGGAAARIEGRLTVGTDGAASSACNLTRQFIGTRL